MESPPRVVLPPIDECLFGPTRRVPKISDGSLISTMNEGTSRSAEDNDKKTDTLNTSDETDTEISIAASQSLDYDYDNFHLGHWGEAATQHDIEMSQLRKVASAGIPDEGSFRGIAWRVLLHYLPEKNINESWKSQVPPKRDFYKQLVDQYFKSSMESGKVLRGQQTKKTKAKKLKKKSSKMDNTDSSQNGNNIPRVEVPANEIEDALPPKFKEQWRRTGLTLDHMITATSETIDLQLNCLRIPEFTDESPQEEFDDFLEDATLLEEIRKDVARTLSHLLFFLETSESLGLRRYAALERILFLWAKLNKGVRYVQGMNEIAGTLYYVLANDENFEWADHAECDAYFLFHTLMMEIRDVFVPDMDSHSTGIQGRIGHMQRLLQTHDPIVFDHLQSCGIDSHFYAYRWLTTLLSREFLLPDTIRLWDSMFASTHKDNFLRYVCVTMVMHVREELLEGDFSANLRLLQRYPPTNVDEILDSSRYLWMYETQISVVCQKRGITWQEAMQYVKPPSGIIMAFGFKEGISPSFQDRLENATGGIMGRAQKLWSGWSKESEEVPPQEEIATSSVTPSFSPAPRSRLWNRVRSNASESAEHLSASSEARSSLPSTNDSGSGLVNSSTDEPPQIQPAASDPTPRRRIWNQSPSAAAREVQAIPSHTPALPTLRTASSMSNDTSTTPGENVGGAVRRLLSRSGWKGEPTATS